MLCRAAHQELQEALIGRQRAPVLEMPSSVIDANPRVLTREKAPENERNLSQTTRLEWDSEEGEENAADTMAKAVERELTASWKPTLQMVTRCVFGKRLRKTFLSCVSWRALCSGRPGRLPHLSATSFRLALSYARTDATSCPSMLVCSAWYGSTLSSCRQTGVAFPCCQRRQRQSPAMP